MGQNPLAYTGQILASEKRVGSASFDEDSFEVSEQGKVRLKKDLDLETVEVKNLEAEEDVKARSVFIEGDEGTGEADTVALTNVVDTAQDVGEMTILSTTENAGQNAGYLKVYIGTDVAYIPYFTDIAP